MQEIIVTDLFGKSNKLYLGQDQAIANVFEGVRVSRGFPSYLAFSLRIGKDELESFGLLNPVNSLKKDEKGAVRIHILLNLTAYGPFIGSLFSEYLDILATEIKKIVEGSNDVADLEEKRIKKLKEFKHFRELRLKAAGCTPTNTEDPITLDTLEMFAVKWIQNGVCFAMNRSSINAHILANTYVDDCGKLQFNNPLTNVPMPEPWRTELYYAATGKVLK